MICLQHCSLPADVSRVISGKVTSPPALFVVGVCKSTAHDHMCLLEYLAKQAGQTANNSNHSTPFDMAAL